MKERRSGRRTNGIEERRRFTSSVATATTTKQKKEGGGEGRPKNIKSGPNQLQRVETGRR